MSASTENTSEKKSLPHSIGGSIDSSAANSAKDSGVKVYLRLLTYAGEYWRIFVVSILGMVVVALSAVAFTALMKPMMDGSFVDRDPETIRWVPPALIAIYFVRAIGAFAASYGMSLVGRNVIYVLRKQMFAKLVSLPKSFYDLATTGELMAKFTYDVEQVASATTKAITVAIRDSLTIIGLIAWMFYLNALLAAVFFIIAPLVATLVVSVSKRFRKISKNIQGSMGDVSRVLEESIKGQQVIKIFGGREYEENQFDQVNRLNRRQNLKMQLTQALSSPVVQFIVSIALASIIFIATSDGMIEKITVGTFMSFLTAMFMMLPPIRAVTSVISDLQRGVAAAESVFSFIDLENENDSGKYTANKVSGEIRFKQLNFNYKNNGTDKSSVDQSDVDQSGADKFDTNGHIDDELQVLSDINLTIQAGQTVAFVGRSGSGKTTLLNLIPRLYEITQGEISLDGENIQNYTLENLRSHISYVGQDVVLFNDTIAHNIAYGQMSEAGTEQINQAATAAYAQTFIEQSSDGLQTIVGERGVMLSGGQRQRIAIARALLKDAPVLILDEATSALDTESERFIQASLEQMMKNRTTLVIAHRLSTIENADVIVVMDNGRIVESGSHQELLALNAHYASLHRVQFKDE